MAWALGLVRRTQRKCQNQENSCPREQPSSPAEVIFLSRKTHRHFYHRASQMISEVTWQFPLSPSRDVCLFHLHWPGLELSGGLPRWH